MASGPAYISGQLPIDSTGKPLSDEAFETPAKQVLANVDACLRTANATRKDLIQVRVFVNSIEQWPAFNKIYAAWIDTHKPARAVAESASLHYGSAVEVKVVALVPTNGDAR